MGQKQAPTEIALLAIVIAGLITSLHQLGDIDALRIDWSDPVAWFGTASTEDAVGGTLRSLGLVVAYWVAISTALYAATGIGRTHRPRAISIVTLPFIRKVVDRTVATALVATIAANPLSPAMADEQPPQPIVFEIGDGIPVPHVVSDTDLQSDDHAETALPTSAIQPAAPYDVVPVPNLVTGLSEASDAAVPATTTAPPTPLRALPQTIATGASVAPTTAVYTGYTVQEGDNLWLIAENHVTATTDGDPTVAATTSYWRRLVDANRHTLRSGDPNLIFAGEIVVIPPVGTTP